MGGEPKMGDTSGMQLVHQTGLFDAHCHPTDIMDSIERIASMKAKVLTVMSTRSQDQELVLNAAEKYPINEKSDLERANGAKYIVPAFGWHPWFSHQLVFDLDPDPESNTNQKVDPAEHYKSVLTSVSEDEAFLKSLMAPVLLSRYLKDTEARLKKFPLALVGEIGLDRGFRLPEGPSSMTGDVSLKTGGDEGAYTPGSREGRPLTPYKVNMEHQKKILKAQLELAAKLRRPVSVHSVQAHGVVFDVLQGLWKNHMKPSKKLLKKQKDAKGADTEAEAEHSRPQEDEPPPYPPRICMHSYSGPKDALRLFLDPKVPAEVFFSFSECINFGNPASNKAIEVIEAVPSDRILIESDLHCAGETMDNLLQDILIRVCQIKSWQLEEGAKILRRNWERFIFGE